MIAHAHDCDSTWRVPRPHPLFLGVGSGDETNVNGAHAATYPRAAGTRSDDFSLACF